MDIKYPIENEFIKCMLQINGFSGSRPRVQSSHRVELGRGGGGGGGGGDDTSNCTCIALPSFFSSFTLESNGLLAS